MGGPLPQFPQPTRPASSYDIEPIPAPSPPEQDFTPEYHNPESLLSRSTSDYEIHTEFRSNPISEDSEQNSGSSSERIICKEQVFTEVYHHPESLSLSKDSKPEIYSEYIDTLFSEPVQCTTSDPDGTSSSEQISFSPPTGKTPKEEKEAVDEMLLILVDCMEELNTRSREALLRKFFAEIEREERLERFIVQRLKHSRVKAISDLCENLPKINSDVESDLLSEGVPVLTRSISQTVEELSLKLERFKVRTLDLGGGVIVKDEEPKK